MNFLDVLSVIVFCGIGVSLLYLAFISFMRSFSEGSSNKYNTPFHWRLYDIAKVAIIVFVIFQLIYQTYERNH